jgi:hypothetical protein
VELAMDFMRPARRQAGKVVREFGLSVLGFWDQSKQHFIGHEGTGEPTAKKLRSSGSRYRPSDTGD